MKTIFTTTFSKIPRDPLKLYIHLHIVTIIYVCLQCMCKISKIVIACFVKLRTKHSLTLFKITQVYIHTADIYFMYTCCSNKNFWVFEKPQNLNLKKIYFKLYILYTPILCKIYDHHILFLIMLLTEFFIQIT